MEIGNLIKEARMAKGLTQEELGKIVGVQKSAIAKYENGRVVNIKRSTLQGLAKALDIRPSSLVGWDETETSIEEIEKKNDTLTDIVLKLNNDIEFFDLVKKISELPPEQLKGLKALLK